MKNTRIIRTIVATSAGLALAIGISGTALAAGGTSNVIGMDVWEHAVRTPISSGGGPIGSPAGTHVWDDTDIVHVRTNR